MRIIELRSAALEVHIDADNPTLLHRIAHRATGTTISESETQRFLVRFPKELSDPVFPNQVRDVEEIVGGIRFELEDEARRARVRCEISIGENGIQWHVDLEAAEPPWMLEWRIGGLDLSRVIVPALGGQYLGGDMPADTQVTYKYPFWWNAQFGIGELGGEPGGGKPGGGIWLRTLDVRPTLKLLRVSKARDRFGLGLGIEADAPLEAKGLSAAWYLDGYEGEWEVPVDRHRGWLETAFDLAPFAEHPRYPAWMNDVNFILEIWGASKERAEPLHTFADMVERIREFARHHPPENTLLYLPGFAEGGIDSNAPDYNPSEKLGGRAGFKNLVNEAHRLGYRVMIHTNVLAMTYTHRLYAEFEQMQVVDAFGRRQGWGNDIDGDWLAEPFFAYMNPGFAEWGEHMRSVIGELIDSFGLDGVFLDQTLLAFNVSNGPNFVEGMRSHVQRLQEAFPDVLFAGEGLHEQMLPALPVAQIHGIDSIAGIHGLEGAREWRHVHPVSSYLFSKYTRLTAHLLTKHPSSSVFERQEASYADLGVMPALVLYRASHEIDTPALKEMLARAKRMSAKLEGETLNEWN